MNKLHWSIDSLILRNSTIFGFGWLFHEDFEIETLRLRILFASSNEHMIEIDHGKPCSNTKQKWSTHHLALNSGFVVYGGYPNHADYIIQISVIGELINGSPFELIIPSNYLKTFSEETAGTDKKIILHQATVLLKRAWGLIRQGRFSSLVDKAGRYWAGIPRNRGGNINALVKYLAGDDIKRVVLVIDHDLGGGANQYRERLIAEKISEGATVLILTYHVLTLNHILVLRNQRTDERYAIPGINSVLDLAREVQLDDIIYNTAVSFIKPEEIPQLIIELKSIGDPHLTMLVHDFFMICPSHFLLNCEGAFCGLPEPKICQACLDKNQQGFATLFASKSMAHWRAAWGMVLGRADQIIAFSQNSLLLLSHAYPDLPMARTIVRPHKVEHIQCKPIQHEDTRRLRIGIVGQIGYHKGSRFVQELSQEIKRSKKDIQIIVIGTLEANCDPSIVKQTGLYKHAELPSLIQETGANIFLFPSIWPETFSYVVQELIGFELPVACFDLGAPAERLRTYSKGLVLNELNASSVLRSLIDFHHRIYLNGEI